ncbi:MAG TPA: hypothetical protein PK718_03765 [Candidatus Methanofastidiosa archaeon]|nr:hypothetical protein [Candidatus Methanofastidiosa archaeon]HPR41649.1 hypothetical protein [Candidatus Methanofastidiosa archaeon]
MKRVAPLIIFILIAVLLTSAQKIEADMGMGISGNSQYIEIESFPIFEERHFTIYNTGDRDALYTVSAKGKYNDVVSWFRVEPTLVYLKRGEYEEISYSIYAGEGYAGSYDVDLIIMGYEDSAFEDVQTGNGTGPYIKVCGSIHITITVSEDAGMSSLGTEHPSTEEQPPDRQPYYQEVFEGIESSGAGLLMDNASVPIYVDIEREVRAGQEVYLDAGFIGSEGRGEMIITLISPSDNTYIMEPEQSFKFEEEGVWGIFISVDGNTVLGRSMNVAPSHGAIGKMGALAAFTLASLVLLPLSVLKIKRKHL